MSRLTRDGTAEPAWPDKSSGTHGDRGMFIFPVQLATSRIGNLTRLIHSLLYVITIHTYIYAVEGVDPVVRENGATLFETMCCCKHQDFYSA